MGDFFSMPHLLVILLVVVLVFGTKKLFGGAKDLGNAVKEFKKAVRDDDSKVTDPIQPVVDPSQSPTDVTRVQRPPQAAAPSDDQRPRG